LACTEELGQKTYRRRGLHLPSSVWPGLPWARSWTWKRTSPPSCLLPKFSGAGSWICYSKYVEMVTSE
ncbi:hypothetical protein A2U01_0112261, partial [Trifolium medium]|nr:hypothetical protein [Trifolium medium]